MRRALSAFVFAGLIAITCLADGPSDNLADKVRPIPPLPKIEATAAEKAELADGVAALRKEIESLQTSLKGKPELLALLPDVQIYYNSVRYAVAHNEIFDGKKEVPIARKQLQIGTDRAKALKDGKAPWTTQTGLVARGYVSKLDGSVQPYGIFVPTTYKFDAKEKHRLDLWCHGRGETLSELNFIQGVSSSPGQFVSPNTFVLQLYGRYCNANKLAGEIDAFEALDNVRSHYRIDNDRLVMRGFSMGGAACWQFAVHYPDVWCAAAPGAGFSETAEFLNVFQNEQVKPTEYEKKLWHVYDCPDYCVNLFNLPTIAYSGENDKQKQAADVMEKAMKAEGLTLPHIIGPKTGHSYHAESKIAINKFVDAAAAKGRTPVPAEVKLQTYTLRYNRNHWVTIEGMEQHWSKARVEAKLAGNAIALKTEGVTALSLNVPAPHAPFDPNKPVTVQFAGGATITSKAAMAADKSWTSKWVKGSAGWTEVESFATEGVKRHGLQGPIDDAFLDRFIMVRPTGKPINEVAGKFADREMRHAVVHWRQQFRGEAIVKEDTQITDADIAESNLILFGDPSSNQVLAKIASKLPVNWTAAGIVIGSVKYSADKHVPVLVCPNPLNPKKYVVLNSGFTFREYDYLNNARQVPKLPDWAVVDATTPMTSRGPGVIVAADFFDEKWQVK